MNQVLLTLVSHAIIISCGDCRIILDALEHIKKEHSFTIMDILTTAGGSRTISFYRLGIREFLIFVIKKLALYADFKKYMGHNAETVVIVDHSGCGFWPKFIDPATEEIEHIKSLRMAGKKIKEKYGEQIKEVILIYAIINEKTHEVIEIKTISSEL